MARKQRLNDIDFSIGFAIMLVVFGHLELQEFSGLTWYTATRSIIYGFHMPLFMFFSGFLMAYSFKPFINWETYLSFLKQKTIKFLPPYILFSVVFIVAENTFRNGSWDNLSQDLFDVFFRSPKSPAGYLWYIYVLFECYVILPLIMKLVRNNVWVLLGFSITLHFIPLGDLFSLNLLSFYLLFVALGFVAVEYLHSYYYYLKKYGYLFISSFVGIIILNNFYYVPKVVFGLFAIPAIHFPIKVLESRLPNWLQLVGLHSFYIYLMNTLVIGALSVFLFKFLNFNPNSFILMLLFICGLLLPIPIYKYIIKWIPILNRIIQ